MTAEELFTELEQLRARLAAHPRYLPRADLRVEDVATDAEVTAAEQRFGIALPPLLRDIYLRVGRSVYFGFEVHEGAWTEDGYPDTGGAEVTIVSVRDLAPARGGRLVPFTNDGIGNGWCLDLDRNTGEVVWHDHDDPDGEGDHVAAGLDAAFDDFVHDVLTRGRVVGGVVVVQQVLGPPIRCQSGATRI